MAVAAYTTDLTTIVDFDGTPASPTVAEPASGWVAGRTPAVDTDFPIQGTNHCSLTMNTTGKAGVLCSNGASFTWTSGHYLFGWIIWLAPGAIATYASGGLAMLCGSSTTDYKVFYVGGSNFGSYPYGGWQNFAVDPTLTFSEVNGTTPTAYNIVGAGANVLSAVSKGNPLGFDVFRYGRGQLLINGGSLADGYATFSGMATANDGTTAKWGLFQAIDGSYKWKGLLSFGATSLTEFVDSNKSIIIDRCDWVNSDFNRIEISNASSIIDWTNISITNLGTIAKGEFAMLADATVNMDTCVFTDMSTFVFDSNATILGTTFRRCGQITQAAGTFDTCLFDDSTAAVALVVDDISVVTDCTFNSDGTGHAINLGTIAATTSISCANFFNSYVTGTTGSPVTTGTSGNEAILVNVASGQTLTINVSTGYDTPSVKNDGTGAVNVVSSVTVTITVKDTTGTVIQNALVGVFATDNGEQIINADTNASGIATAGYGGTKPREVKVWIRKASSGETRYKNYSSIQNITSNGLDLAVTLIIDPNNNATT